MGDSPFSGCAVLLHEWQATEVHRKYWGKHTTACRFYRTEYLRTICLLSFLQRYLMIYENGIKPEYIYSGRYYRSVLYIVNSLFEESWSEEDHDIIYPLKGDMEFLELLN